ncbi:hypothetical protein ADK64_17770 [Streptomyces sp. MMG1121]|nr:hypothetical protein ADK64_17770 [Streptomyces sp. MMG1121]
MVTFLGRLATAGLPAARHTAALSHSQSLTVARYDDLLALSSHSHVFSELRCVRMRRRFVLALSM